MPINLSELSPQQQEAATMTEGPLLIIAGPGSGKTKTLVARALYLLFEKKVSPDKIMLATFTEKAARELLTRIADGLIKENIRVNLHEMYIGTLHSIFLRFLEENSDYTRLKKSYQLLDEFDQQYLIYKKLKSYLAIEDINTILDRDKQSRWDKAEVLVNAINKVSEEMLDADKLLASQDKRICVLGRLYQLYVKDLEENNALDFSTIQSELYSLLEKNKEVLEKLQDQIKYVMIDEYQDTNTVQELILLKLTEKHNNLCVVGDDDQGLYRFRGATIRNILEFPNNFKKIPPPIKLQTNYRSHPDIIDFYSAWMKQQPVGWKDGKKQFRFEKDVAPPKDKKFPKYKSVIRVAGSNGKDNWGKEVVAFLTEIKRHGKLTDLNQAAFLFKSVRNDKVKALARYLEANGIPVFSPRSDMFFERDEVRLLIGALIFMFPQYAAIRKWADNIELDVWNYYDDCFVAFAEQLRKTENKELQKWVARKAKAHNPMSKNTDYAFAGLFYQLMQFPLFKIYFDIDLQSGATDTRPLYNLALFSQLLTKFEYLERIPNVISPAKVEQYLKSLFNQYFKFLIDGGIGEYEEFEEYAPSGCVSFMTIHQSKGLEFPIVFVGSLNLVPRKQYTDLDELLQKDFYRKPPFEPIANTKYYDFWRLFYTAFSRAQNLLVMTGQEHEGKGLSRYPSSYFAPLYNKLLSWGDGKANLDKLVLVKIKDIHVKKEYSFTSHILLFENCAMQYKYYKELAFSPVRQGGIIFGTLIHQTIEDIHKHAIKGEADKINEKNIAEWFEQNYSALTKSEHAFLGEQAKAAALKQTIAYADRHRGKWDLIQEAEVDVSLVKDDYILKGTIDLIRGENDTVEIVDFKSDDKPSINEETEKMRRYRRQLEIYAHLVEERTSKKVSKMHLYYTKEDKGSPYVTFDKSSVSVAKTIKEFDSIVAKIQGKDFAIKERPGKLCQDCDIRFYCNAK